MHKHSLFCRAAALVLTLALTAALALPGFAAAYAMPIQTAYDAEAVYLFDASTGEALVEQNPDQVRPIASLTKMMTALLVLESGADLNESITIPDSLTPEFQAIRANRGHTIGLQAGESVRRLDMLYAMLVPSANDAASVLASDAAGGDLAAFAARMNARASQLGCTNTHFTCPHGLYDHNNYSTARDVAKIALACHANGTYMQVANTVSYTLPATNLHPARNISSTNRLLKPGSAYYRGYAQGMKTGFTTQAGRCFVTFASQNGRTYGLVILGSNSQNIFRNVRGCLIILFRLGSHRGIPAGNEVSHQIKAVRVAGVVGVVLYISRSAAAQQHYSCERRESRAGKSVSHLYSNPSGYDSSVPRIPQNSAIEWYIRGKKHKQTPGSNTRAPG